MASSGRLDPAFLALMNSTVTVNGAVTTGGGTDPYGERDTVVSSRQVKCYLAPFVVAEQAVTDRSVLPTWAIYADDIDIKADDKVTLPDGTTNPIDRIETYDDGHGPVYQVVMV